MGKNIPEGADALGTPPGVEETRRDRIGRITSGELMLACSHYALGNVKRVHRMHGGSRTSPKVVLESDKGTFLLKRRAPGQASAPEHVALTHEIMLHAERAGLPAPHLVGTRADNNSMLQLPPHESKGGGGVYEVYKFVRGRDYARSTDDAFAAGSLLARLHHELRSLKVEWPVPTGSFHRVKDLATLVRALPAKLAMPDLHPICASLADVYEQAAGEAEAAILNSASDPLIAAQIIHSDWHPGNILFSRTMTGPAVAGEDVARRVAAILDFDSARLAPPLFDAANGAMQFALGKHLARPAHARTASARSENAHQASPPPAGEWRISLNPDLFGSFWTGYRSYSPRLTPALAKAVPWLMVEALIVEAVAPVLATGELGRLDALAGLRMIDRAARSFVASADRLARLAAGT